MKAKAPERIYCESDGIGNTVKVHNIKWPDDEAENIEYTRTEVFLKKAEEFFEDHLTEEDCKFGSSEWTELRAEYESLDSFIRAFKNYMKGE